MRRLVMSAAAAVAAVAVTGLIVPRALAQTGPADRVPVATDQPAGVSHATATGTVPDGTPVQIQVYLADRDRAGLTALVHDISDPHSPSYRHYLTPAEFRARFAPTEADLATVRSWLTGAGFTIAQVPANRLYVTATGTAAAADKAFDTTLRSYQENGRSLRAISSPATMPATLAGAVLGVTGLATPSNRATPALDPATKAAFAKPSVAGAAGGSATPAVTWPRVPQPCSNYYGEKVDTTDPPAYGKSWPYAVCGYTPAQLRAAYGVAGEISAGNNGHGTTVAVIGAYASANMPADTNTYSGRHGLPAFTSGQYQQILPSAGFHDGDACGESLWNLEQTLDVEAVHSFAPGANVTYVAAASCDDTDLLVPLNTIVDNHLADVVSNSWLDLEQPAPLGGMNGAYHQAFEQAATEGITVAYCSGDYGDLSAYTPDGKPAAAWPAVDPLVTGVGGTGLAISSSNTYQFEDGWSTATTTLTNGAWNPTPPGLFRQGSGGGAGSATYPEPDYQQGVVPPAMATANGGTADRVVPDIALDGQNETGFRLGFTQTFPDGTYYDESRVGGTSLSTPLFAAIVAIVDQMYKMNEGFINPVLYGLAGTSALHDVVGQGQHAQVRLEYVNGADASAGVQTTLRTDQFWQTLHTAPGYDNVTGLGSPNGGNFFKALGPIGG